MVGLFSISDSLVVKLLVTGKRQFSSSGVAIGVITVIEQLTF